MGWRGFAAAALVLAAAAPLAPATFPACDAAAPLLAAPTRAAQDDAKLGRDAPDEAPGDARLPMPPPADGEQGDYYWAWLDPPVLRDGADASDWYAFELSPVEKVLMLELVSNYTPAGGMALYTDFRAVAHGPDRVVHLHSAQGRAYLDDAVGGVWRVQVVPDVPVAEAHACGGFGTATGAAAPTGAFSNHGLYVGCRPVCLADAAART